MGMDMSSGKIRSLSSVEDLKETEVLFVVGEEVELKGCKFDVMAVFPDPANEITLKGKAQSLRTLADWILRLFVFINGEFKR